MKIEGERILPGTPRQLWRLLLNPDVLVSAIPGCKELDKTEEDHYEGIINAKVGNIQSRYTTTFQIADKDPPTSYRLNVQGQGRGGFVNAEMQMMLAPVDGGTQLRYSGTANVGGRLAQVGQRMVNATATTMAEKGFDNLHERIRQEVKAGPDGAARLTTREPRLWERLKRAFKSIRTFVRALFQEPHK